MMVPAPKKPMPLITCAPSRPGSPAPLLTTVNRYWLVIMVTEDPKQTKMWVRNPAARRFFPRSMPMSPPHKVANSSRRKMETGFSSAKYAVS